MPILEANQAKIYYELYGEGQPIILISGYACDHFYWQPVLDELSTHFQVLVLDNRGCGQTTDHEITLSAELMAQDIITIADKLNLVKPHIIGHSMGGAIAQIIADLYSDKINKVCLLNTSVKLRQAALLGLHTSLILREKNMDFDLILDSILPWLFGETFLSNQKNLSEFKKNIIENPYPQSLTDQKRQFNVLKQFDGRKYLKNIKIPTLVISGTQDILSLPHESDYLVNHIQGAILEKLDCAHGIIYETPEQIANLLIKFLSIE